MELANKSAGVCQARLAIPGMPAPSSRYQPKRSNTLQARCIHMCLACLRKSMTCSVVRIAMRCARSCSNRCMSTCVELNQDTTCLEVHRGRCLAFTMHSGTHERNGSGSTSVLGPRLGNGSSRTCTTPHPLTGRQEHDKAVRVVMQQCRYGHAILHIRAWQVELENLSL